MDVFIALYIFILAAITGYELVSKVPVLLHTALLSGSTFIHGIVLVGAMLVMGSAETAAETIIGFIAVALAAANIVGGYVATSRMLGMFDKNSSKNEGDE